MLVTAVGAAWEVRGNLAVTVASALPVLPRINAAAQAAREAMAKLEAPAEAEEEGAEAPAVASLVSLTTERQSKRRGSQWCCQPLQVKGLLQASRSLTAKPDARANTSRSDTFSDALQCNAVILASIARRNVCA